MRKTLQLTKLWPLASCVDCGEVCVWGGTAKDKHLKDVPPDWYNAVATLIGPEVMIRQGFGPRASLGPHLCKLRTMRVVPDRMYEEATLVIDPSAWED